MKIKDPLFGTQWEYEPNKPQELGLAYWGGVVDNAQRVAKNENEQDKAAALMMLRMAVDAITGSEAAGTSCGTQGGVLQKISGGIENKKEYNA